MPVPLTDSPCLQGEHVALTGTLASMTHRQAFDLIARHGGSSSDHISSQTSMLVIGEEGWPLESNGQPSVKLLDASERARLGQPLKVLHEREWLHLLDLDKQPTKLHREYTTARLSHLLGVPVQVIRRWERVGLIRPSRRVKRMSYFDFQEVQRAQMLSGLLAEGVSRAELEQSLLKLESLVGDEGRSLTQLELLAQDARIVYRDNVGFLEPTSGQRLFDFEDEADRNRNQLTDAKATIPLPSWSVPEHQRDWAFRDWFDQGRQLSEDGQAEEAVEAFRICLMERPGEAEVNFHLAEALYRCDRPEGALERYYAAVESDHEFIEAWVQLGCLHAERAELDAALEAFEVALTVHSDFPDAHWEKAAVLCQLDRIDEAVPHWQRYLEFDHLGPWADQARQRLEEAGVADAVAVTAGN